MGVGDSIGDDSLTGATSGHVDAAVGDSGAGDEKKENEVPVVVSPSVAKPKAKKKDGPSKVQYDGLNRRYKLQASKVDQLLMSMDHYQGWVAPKSELVRPWETYVILRNVTQRVRLV